MAGEKIRKKKVFSVYQINKNLELSAQGGKNGEKSITILVKSKKIML